MNTQVDRTFRRLERRSERIIAGLRLLALLVLALVFDVVGVAELGRPTMVPLAGFAAIPIATPVLVNRLQFGPWVLWLFAALDVAFPDPLPRHARRRNRPASATGLGDTRRIAHLRVLAAAAVRHRPFLILYTGGLSVAGWLAIWLWAAYTDGNSQISGTLTANLARLAVVGLTTYTLFVSVKRARRASFVDLRGFTALAERMPADEVANFLNEYRRRIAEPIARHHGTIDKFIGDGVMTIFGVPEPTADDARNAVLAGVELVAVIDRWRNERVAEGLPPVEIVSESTTAMSLRVPWATSIGSNTRSLATPLTPPRASNV